ncbi:MAG: branched-chain amino acid ABC transporter permease [Deltaproteobacteria bacterium]|nr:branched-chain amino acid ABC transporter permease [Deltaproteobacteria bacterium]MBW2077213.1 branched-chain amino acid ABC transporter permease [Deltaproteobacteria bacterium]MBW2311807.1 branched-chain amino acid ABC transporter permease [Deltaproteobacteria bacterium]
MSIKATLFPIFVYAILAPLPLVSGEYYTHVLNISFYYVVMAASWNLIAGYTGQFSLAHHAFAAMGGYTSALLVIHYKIPILLGIPCGGILAGAFGYFLGTLCLRMRAIYLGLSTWAFSESFRITLSMSYKLTRGDLGLSTPRLLETAKAFPYYYIFLLLAIVCLCIMYKIVHSRIGYYMRSIRDDEEAALTMGVDTVKWKRFVFVTSSLFAGIAGAFHAHYIGLLSPVSVDFNEMAILLIMVITGGLRTFAGPIIGAISIEILSELLREYGEIRMVLFALMVIVIMRVNRDGIVGIGRTVLPRIRYSTTY